MRRIAAAAVALAAIAAAAVVATRPPPRPPPDLAAVEAALEITAPVDHVWMRVEGDFGVVERGPVPELVALGSVRKWTTAAVVMMLVDEGRLSLDAPIATWLPAWSARPGVTLRRLMAHTAGLPGRPRDGSCGGQQSLAACMDAVAEAPALFEPGARFGYSTLGFQLAARAAEVAAGQPFEALFAERLAGPLGWTGWRFDPAGEGLADMEGTLWARPADVLAFVALIDTGRAPDGQRLLSDAALRELEAGQTGAVPRIGQIPRWEWWGRGDDPYTLGAWRARDVDGRPRFLFAEGRQEVVVWTDRGSGVRSVLQVRYARRTRLDERMLVFGGLYALCAQLDPVGEVGGWSEACLPWTPSAEQLRTLRQCRRGAGPRDLCLAAGLRTP